jgi:hypothetical protein
MIRRSFVFAAAAAVLVALAIPAAIAFGGDSSNHRGDAPVFAATALGGGFTYQGRLTDGGEPANGTYDLRFFLYDAAAGGAQVGPEVLKEDVVVTEGVFTVQLDFGAGIFKGDALWLEIAVKPGTGGAFTVLNPRQPITAVPYSLHAMTAGGFALPFSQVGSNESPNSLLKIEQMGTGIGLQVLRSNVAATIGPAILGTNAGAGAGVQGTSNAVDGPGVVGLATAAGGQGGLFKGETAIQLDGAIKVSGTAPAAFVQVVAAPNLCLSGTGTIIDNANANDDPNAIIIATVNNGSAGGLTVGDATVVLAYDDGTLGCATGRWVIMTESAGPNTLSAGDRINVLVVNQ